MSAPASGALLRSVESNEARERRPGCTTCTTSSCPGSTAKKWRGRSRTTGPALGWLPEAETLFSDAFSPGSHERDSRWNAEVGAKQGDRPTLGRVGEGN